jgi:hypothetical protein
MEIQGLVFLVGTVAVYAFVLLGCMERRLRRVARAVREAEEDNKYVN